MILRYRGTDTTAKDILGEFGIRTRAEIYNEHPFEIAKKRNCSRG